MSADAETDDGRLLTPAQLLVKMAVMARAILYEAAEKALGDVPGYLRKLREDGLSFSQMVVRLREDTGVAITTEGMRQWLLRLERRES